MTELSTKELQRDYEAYAKTLATGVMAPQTQGMVLEDFRDARLDLSSRSTSMRTDDGNTLIPQLSPILNLSWLNEDYYRTTFPDATKKRRVFNFTEVPGLDPSDSVRQGISLLALGEGVVVFDYPDSDPEYPARLYDLLRSIGVRPVEVHNLGTQTYYTGKVQLKRLADDDRKEPTMRINDSFRIQEAAVLKDSEGAHYLSSIDPEQTISLNSSYDKAFGKVKDHPCRQGLTIEEFTDLVTFDTSVAKVVYRKAGKLATLCMLGDDPGKFGWVNQDFFSSRYPEETEKNQVVYFPAIATDPEQDGERFGQHVINHITSALELGRNEIIVGFDCCDLNATWLPGYLSDIINKSPEVGIDFNIVGKQVYKAVSISQ